MKIRKADLDQPLPASIASCTSLFLGIIDKAPNTADVLLVKPLFNGLGYTALQMLSIVKHFLILTGKVVSNNF